MARRREDDHMDDDYAEADAWDDAQHEDEDDTGALYGEGIDDPVRHPNPRRTQATVVMVIASIVFLVSLVVLAAFTIGSGGFRGVFDFWSFRTWIWVLFGAMVVLFVWLLVLLLTTPKRSDDDWFDEDEIPVAQPGRLGAPDTITLRCPDCVNIFSLQDPMTRPFYHDCPHCGVRGVYTGKDDPPEVVARLESQGHGSHA